MAKYGLTEGDYESMLAEQGGGCAVCRATTVRQTGIKFFHVDHCHETGEVRGLLCGPCNKGLGAFSDDPALLLRAAEYLRRTQPS